MSTLPLSFRINNAVIEKHQLEGTDPSERYFNRSVFVKRIDRGYRGKITYESLEVEGTIFPTIGAAIQDVVDKLRDFGFINMRTRLNFKGKKYLAERETWIDYPD